MGVMFSGIIGGVFIVIALVPSLLSVLKKHRAALSLEFVTFYFVGVLMLAVYAIEIDDRVSLTLNTIAMMIAFVNFYYIPNKLQRIEDDLHITPRRKKNAGKGKKRA